MSHELVLGRAWKGNSTCHQLEKEDAYTIDIGLWRDLFGVIDLLWGHIGHCPKCRTRHRFALFEERLSDPKVREFGDRFATFVGQQNVGWLDVSVYEILLVDIVKGFDYRAKQYFDFVVAEGAAFFVEIGAQVLTFDPLHHATKAVLFIDHVGDVDNIGVFEAKLDARFFEKAAADGFVL